MTDNQMKNLFLQQSYFDAWESYEDSLKKENFIRWDYVVLTASNENQAEGYRHELQERLQNGWLPKQTTYLVVADPDGKRVGSGGATLNVLKTVRERESEFQGLRILTIHSGGDSKRVPQYSACGKLFSPVPRELPDGRRSTLFDEFVIGMSGVASRISEGMLVLSGDVLLLFNPLQIDGQIQGAAAISIKERAEIGQNHGVFLNHGDGFVEQFLHKQDKTVLERAGAVNEHGKVDLDTGAILLSVPLLDALYGLVCEDSHYSDSCFAQFVNEVVRLSFYGDFLYPLAEGATLLQYMNEMAEGEISEALLECRKIIWDAISGFSLKLISLSPAQFIHFGTTRELQQLLTAQIDDYANLGWRKQVASVGETWDGNGDYAASNAYVGKSAVIGRDAYIENSFVLGKSRIGAGAIVSGLRLVDAVVPDGMVCHGLRLKNHRFVIRVYRVDDNPKDMREYDLWNDSIFPVCDSQEEAWEWTKLLFALMDQRADEDDIQRWKSSEKISLQESYQMADYQAETDWQRELTDRVASRKFENVILQGLSETEALGVFGSRGVTEGIYQELMCDAKTADSYLKLRIYHGLLGYLKNKGDGLNQEDALLAEALEYLCYELIQKNCVVEAGELTALQKICESEVTVELPVRVNWGGGWTDTPPYCQEHGGVVLNAAIKIHGICPVQVCVRRLEAYQVEFESADVGVHGVFDNLEVLRDCRNPYDSFALHKAALLVCGVIPAQTGPEVQLKDVLERLGGGIYLSTQVSGIPKGSGLGTSSILSAACVKAVYRFMGVSLEDAMVSKMVLHMEQMMSTGGGWQDQVGGLIKGVKLITSKVGNNQELSITQLQLSEETKQELQERFALIYTGQRRLARNLLRDVVNSYIEGRPDSVEALHEMKPLAALMAFYLEQGDVDAFAKLLNQHWERSLQLDAGTTNTCIEQIFLSIEDLIDGRFICGAGGGGFLQVIMKRGVTKEMLHERLYHVFWDSGVDVWESEFVW